MTAKKYIWGEGIVREFGMGIYTLLYLKTIKYIGVSVFSLLFIRKLLALFYRTPKTVVIVASLTTISLLHF